MTRQKSYRGRGRGSGNVPSNRRPFRGRTANAYQSMISKNGNEETRESNVRKENERSFFEEFFNNEPGLLAEYKKRLSENSDDFIKWEFLPTLYNIKYLPLNTQYRLALNDVKKKCANRACK